MARRLARAAAMQLVFENMLGGDGGQETLRDLIEFQPEGDDQAFIDGVLHGTQEHADEIDATIAKYLKDWSLERISKVAHAVLRVAVYELTWGDTPRNVVVSEAVALAQRFDSPEGGKFVNGVLSSVLRDLPETAQA